MVLNKIAPSFKLPRFRLEMCHYFPRTPGNFQLNFDMLCKERKAPEIHPAVLKSLFLDVCLTIQGGSLACFITCGWWSFDSPRLLHLLHYMIFVHTETNGNATHLSRQQVAVNVLSLWCTVPVNQGSQNRNSRVQTCGHVSHSYPHSTGISIL